MADQDQCLTTFAEAEDLGAHKLARRWLDLTGSPRTPEKNLDELATMAALAGWLSRWLPTQIHRTLVDGASVEQAAAAVGMTPAQLADVWRQWDQGQRHLWRTYPDMDRTGEHDQVAELLAGHHIE
jgi:hypothetical protein